MNENEKSCKKKITGKKRARLALKWVFFGHFNVMKLILDLRFPILSGENNLTKLLDVLLV